MGCHFIQIYNMHTKLIDKKLQNEDEVRTQTKYVKEMFVPLSVAKKEAWDRWNNKKLRKKVEEFLKGDIPGVLQNEPRAVLARHITTPNLEYQRFLDLANLINLEPVNFEFLRDKFVSENLAKQYLCRMPFLDRKDGQISFEEVINFSDCEKKPLDQIVTANGKKLPDFHHDILEKKSKKIEVFDLSDWYSRKGGRAREYMKYYLALFICHGVLFENYLTDEGQGEAEFTKNIVYPSLKKVEEIFGVKPLIVPLVPIKEETDLFWWCYHKDIEKFVKSC